MKRAVLLLAALFIALPAPERAEPGRSGQQIRTAPRGAMGMPFIERVQTLSELWYVQSSAKVKATGAEISQSGFPLENWYPAVVPSTVLGTLVQNNIYPDIMAGDNLKNVPEEPFKVSWWYRREFLVEAGRAAPGPGGPGEKKSGERIPGEKTPPEKAAKPGSPGPGGSGISYVGLEFDGLNYRANVWLNGKKIADAKDLYGAFRRFELDITSAAPAGQKSVLAVEVFPPQPGDPTIGFVDWNPWPPDKSMGLWREVRVRSSGDVSIRFPFVQTKLNLETLAEARLTVSAELRNNTAAAVAATLEGRIEKSVFSQKVNLGPKETKVVTFTPDQTPELVLVKPRLWWTHDFGQPELYRLFLTVRAGERPSDMASVRFGVREVSDYFNEYGYRGFKLNGKKILIRGGGWVDDLLLDVRPHKLQAEVLYAIQANLNALRLEGFWGTSQALFDLCDQNGLLLLAGWSCQFEWPNLIGKAADKKYGAIISPEDIRLVADSWRDQVKWLRHHPSILVWLMASDLLPKPELEEEYRKILAQDDPTRPSLVSAADRTSTVSGKSGVKMNGPYDWVPPNYWYLDAKRGGAYGFNTETGPGAQPPPAESLRRMFPPDKLWPPNDVWDFHCCRSKEFGNLKRYNAAMDARIGPAKDLDDYAVKAQFLNYEGMRAMFEAFTANKYKSTGVIQWMYNAAWPKLWWQLYDYYLMPTGAFYGARKAGEPKHLLYRYDTGDVVAVNNTRQPVEKHKATIRVLDAAFKELYRKSADVALSPDEAKRIDTLPKDIKGLTTTSFVDLRLLDKEETLVSANFYALSTKPDVLDEATATWFVTPVAQPADLTALDKLPRAELRWKEKFRTRENGTEVVIEFENPGAVPAVMVDIRIIRDATNEPVLPVFLEDNYVTIFPGEKRTVSGFVLTDDLAGENPALRITWWNRK